MKKSVQCKLWATGSIESFFKKVCQRFKGNSGHKSGELYTPDQAWVKSLKGSIDSEFHKDYTKGIICPPCQAWVKNPKGSIDRSPHKDYRTMAQQQK